MVLPFIVQNTIQVWPRGWKEGLGGWGHQGHGEEWGRETLPGSPSNPRLSLEHFSHSEAVGVAVPGTVSHADPQTLRRPSSPGPIRQPS